LYSARTAVSVSALDVESSSNVISVTFLNVFAVRFNSNSMLADESVAPIHITVKQIT
jgi:hypothetical protein